MYKSPAAENNSEKCCFTAFAMTVKRLKR